MELDDLIFLGACLMLGARVEDNIAPYRNMPNEQEILWATKAALNIWEKQVAWRMDRTI